MKKFFSILIFLLSYKVHASHVDAAHEFSLEYAINKVWNESPQIKGQKIQLELSTSDRWRRFLINEPQFQFTNSDDNSANSFGLSITTAFPGKAFALRSFDVAKENSQRLELSSKKYDLAKVILQSYLDCAIAQAVNELQIVTSSDMETVYKSLKSAYEGGHSTQAEKIGSELLARQAHLDLITTEDKKENLCKKFELTYLRAVDDSPSVFEGNNKITLPDDINESIISELGTSTADQSRSNAAIGLANASFQAASWSQLPDITFSANRNHYLNLTGGPTGTEWTTSYAVSLTLPLLYPFHESNEVKKVRSQAMIDQNSAELLKTTSDADKFDGAKEYRRSRARLKELRTIDLALAEALVESTSAAYRAGKLGFAELVLSRKTLADLRNQDIQLRSSIILSHLRCLSDCETIKNLTKIENNL